MGATIADAQGVVTILNDDTAAPTISIADTTVVEGNSGTANMTFTVSLSAASTQSVTVAYATSDGTATAGSDYTTASGTVTFNPGVTQQTVGVTVTGDTTTEPNETLLVTLSNPLNATLLRAQATGTITNDDAALPALTIGSRTVTEGDSGTLSALFTVTLSAASAQTVSASYATADVTATAGIDYTTTAGTVTFAPGVTTQTITVPVVGDTLDEANETFVVNLSAPQNATLGTPSQGTGTITDNDPTPSLRIDDLSVTEGNSGTVTATFTVTLSAASGRTVTVNYATSNGTATAASGDYLAASGTLSFAPGITTRTVAVTVNGDVLNEADETVNVNLSTASGATIADTRRDCHDRQRRSTAFTVDQRCRRD